MNLHVLCTLIVVLGGTLLGAPVVSAQKMPENIARGLTASFEPTPNYGHCTDPGDPLQLTDGLYSGGGTVRKDGTGAIWVQQGTVGWSDKSLITIRFDLGSVQPISGISVSTAAGASGVEWPKHIFVWVSNDQSHWHNAGDLMQLSRKDGSPPAGYTPWRYSARDLELQGRYVAFIVSAIPYFFCDEIEIYRGADSLLQKPLPAQVAASIEQIATSSVVNDRVVRRLRSDHEVVTRKLHESTLPPRRRSELQSRLDKAAADTDALERQPPPADPNFRTVIPLNEIEARVLAVHGAILGGAKPGLVLWREHRYGWLSLLSSPPRVPVKPVVQITAMKNELRPDSLLVTNASEKTLPLHVKLSGLSKNEAAAIQIASTVWTDTWQGIPVASALQPISDGAKGLSLSLPAGMTAKLWFTADGSGLVPKNYRGAVVVETKGQTARADLAIRISPVALPRPRLSLGMWDYTDGKGWYGVTPTNRPALIKIMRDHHVDSPWAQGEVLPKPSAADFTADNQLKATLDFTDLDAWVAMWPDARRRLIFLNVLHITEFAGAKLGTPEFNARVGAWMRAVVHHIREKKWQPDRFYLLLVDEPKTEQMAQTAVDWMKVIKTAAPELRYFTTPNWEHPEAVKPQEMLTDVDLLCPQLGTLYVGGPALSAYYEQRRLSGQEFWFYQAIGPVHLFDPTVYYRRQALQAFARKATGIGFWAIADTGGTPSSWNDYAVTTSANTPIFLDKDTVTNSLHWEAVREGIQDYEYLSMVRDKIAVTRDAAWKKKAQQLMAEVEADTVGRPGVPDHAWISDQDPGAPDGFRLRALALLESAR